MSKRFLPGNDGMGGGRPQGAKNRLQTKFLYDLAEDWEAHGAGVIKIVRIERPDRYLQIVASIMPKELLIEPSILSDLPDDELATLLDRLRQVHARLDAGVEIEAEAVPALSSPDSVH